MLAAGADVWRARRGSDSDDLDDDLAWARAVELDKEDALPLSQAKLALVDRDHLARRKEEPPAVGVSVRPLVWRHVDGANGEVVVAKADVARRQPGEPFLHVRDQQRLVLVDANSGRRVPREDQHQALTDAGVLDERGDPIGGVEEARRARRLQGEALARPRRERDRGGLQERSIAHVVLPCSASTRRR